MNRNSPPPDDLESHLHTLKPAPLSPHFRARLLASRPDTTPSSRRGLVRVLCLAGLSAAAAVVFLMIPQRGAPGTSSPNPGNSPTAATSLEAKEPLPPRPEIVENTKYLVDLKPVGLIHDSERRPVRLLNATWLDSSRSSEDGIPRTALRREIIPVYLDYY